MPSRGRNDVLLCERVESRGLYGFHPTKQRTTIWLLTVGSSRLELLREFSKPPMLWHQPHFSDAKWKQLIKIKDSYMIFVQRPVLSDNRPKSKKSEYCMVRIKSGFVS